MQRSRCNDVMRGFTKSVPIFLLAPAHPGNAAQSNPVCCCQVCIDSRPVRTGPQSQGCRECACGVCQQLTDSSTSHLWADSPESAAAWCCIASCSAPPCNLTAGVVQARTKQWLLRGADFKLLDYRADRFVVFQAVVCATSSCNEGKKKPARGGGIAWQKSKKVEC